MVSEISVHFHLAQVLLGPQGESTSWQKLVVEDTAQSMVATAAKKRETEKVRVKYTFQGHTPTDPPTGPHLPTVHSAMNP
jgi:hypothetical protein